LSIALSIASLSALLAVKGQLQAIEIKLSGWMMENGRLTSTGIRICIRRRGVHQRADLNNGFQRS
jgi:hypothetical protein